VDKTLEHGGRVYDWWGRHPRLFRFVDEIVCLGRRQQLHRRAVDALGLRAGETVLDLACGHGVNFALLENAIGSSGHLVALDYSEQMVTAARDSQTSQVISPQAHEGRGERTAGTLCGA
jgi:ubiquinone/menaquinone biosynthesis C-methylase UbiE